MASLIRPGLCSVTLRAMPVEDVVAVASDAGLECIEWGGDVHVPPGDLAAAQRAARLTEAAGIAVASYGSYFRAGHSPQQDFAAILASARELGAPRIRIWAGKLGSGEAPPEERRAVVEATRRAADVACEHGIDLGFEFHRHTLTDDADSTCELLSQVDRTNVTSYWQPPVGAGDSAAVATLRRLGDVVPAVHVYSWWPDTQRLPLAGRRSLWDEVFTEIQRYERDVDALLEFVADDAPANVVRDAGTLGALIQDAKPR